MDSNYICTRLKKLVILLYGKKYKPYAKEKKGIFTFGSKKYNMKNKVTKPIALYLIAGANIKIKQ